MSRIHSWLTLSIAFVLIGAVIRIYEYITVTQNFILPENTESLYTAGFFFDLIFFSVITLFVLPIYLLISSFSQNLGEWLSFSVMTIILVGYILIIQYFAEVLVPLGSDFFAYNFTELTDTVSISVDITIGRVLPVLFFPILFLFTWKAVSTIQPSHGFTVITGSVLVISGLCFVSFNPSQSDYEREIEYSIAANKAQIFSAAMLGSSPHAERKVEEYSGEEFPLLRSTAAPDVLGPLFNQSDNPPNIVLIMVEGFGGSFMPPHADYGGFTPFLDSLATESLNWTHFLSTSGRSFNAQPSILASLPYGERGFMEMGFRAPAHHSLISILNDNGYQTSYFGGYESRFDNLDQFLEKQQIDLLVDASRFPDTYSKMDEIEGGFTWGYSDKDTYLRAFDFINEFGPELPRLDIYFTLNLHEPFIIQNSEMYDEIFNNRLADMDIIFSKRNEYLQYRETFKALLYTDDAIKQLIDQYREREDFDRTIFIITGDHRLIPIPHRNRIDRYYVPFMIYSPMLKSPQTFNGISSHLDIVPSLLSYLEENYDISQPESVHWLGEGLSVSEDFEANHKIPFMRNKNEMLDYLSEQYYLSGDQLFELEPGMLLRPMNNFEIMTRLQKEFDEFKSMNLYVTSNNKIIPADDSTFESGEELASQTFLGENNLLDLNVEELFYRAREMAFTGQYEDARLILRHILRERPNFHDSRLLFGRTFGWEESYQLAEQQFDEVLRRNPSIADAYAAKADLYYWQNQPDVSIEIINRGLNEVNANGDLLFRKARAFRQKGDLEAASELTDEALQQFPDHEDLRNLNAQL